MSIDPTNVAQTTASTVATTTTTPAASSLSSLGAEEEEESTLVEVSPSSSSSSPTTVSSLSALSRTSSAGTGDDGSEPHPEELAHIAATEKPTKTTTMTITSEDATASADSSEASTVALVEDLTPEQIHRQQQQQQPTIAPVAAQVASDLPIEHQPRSTLPIQSSSSLSTPSSSEDYDESVTTSSTEGALNVSSSNNRLNNNNNSTAIGSSDQQETATELSAIESVLLPLAGSTATLVTSTPERTPSCKAEEEEQRQAPIEIVQIFPSTATTLSSSITSSSSSSSPSSGSSSSTGTSSASSTSSSPSVSPLAVDQQQPATAAAAASTTPPQVRAEAPPLKMDDSAICDTEIGDLVNAVTVSDQEVPQKQRRQLQDVDAGKHTLMYHNRISSSSPQLQSSLKKYKMGERSSESRRRVSFPKDSQLITGYLEPIDPWACVTIISVPELNELYRRSCTKHSTEPLPMITEHLKKLDLAVNQRVPLLSLKDQNLGHGSCEALEEIFKRVQYRSINLSNAGLDDTSASVLFDMIEYYEAANELDISDNLAMTNKSWLACINMVKKSQALNVLITRGPGISEHHAMNLAKALNTSALHTLKLEHCELSQRPLATLCNLLKRNTILRELSLAHNQLTCDDARNIANLLRSNYHIQLLDISNNSIGDKGVEYIVNALIEQSIYFKTMQETKRKSEFSFADLSSSLININTNKHYFPKSYGKPSQSRQSKLQQQQHLQPKLSASSLAGAMSPTPLKMLMHETPRTPPPTPALPVRTPSAEVLLVATSLPPPVESQEEEPPPPLLSTAPAEATTALDESSDLQEKSTNNDSGINSSVSSEAEQTISDSSGSIVVSTEVQQQKTQPGSDLAEEHLLAGVVPLEHDTRVDGMVDSETTTSDISGDNLVDSGLVVCDSQDNNNRTDSASDVEGNGEEGNVTDRDRGGEIQTLELTFDLGDEVQVKGPKKARLAKQDSVLSEFESSMPELKLKTDIPKMKTTPGKVEEPMDEDTPEVCADYDDSNLKIVEENLLIDRSINATSSESNDTKEEEEEDKHNTTDNDDSAPVTPLTTHKKDELQLLLEKAKQREEQDEENIDPLPMLKGTLQSTETVAANDTVEDMTSAIAPQSLGASIPLKIVEGQLKDKPLSRSLDSAGSSEFESPFLGGSQPPAFPNERSFSSESLNSETSVDSNDSKSSLKIIESKFATRNGTLERQQSNASRETQLTDQAQNTPCGLQVLVLWNNEITRNSAQTFSDLIENTSTLEILNAGCNLLCNDFVGSIKSSLKANSSLTSLGLQGAHLSDNGAKVMAEVIEFGGNASLQRIDLRNNNILATGLDYLNEAMKSNKSVTRIDLDDVPRRVVENSLEIGPEYTRLLNNIRAQCERNKHPQEPSEPISTSIKRLRNSHLSSRKISLTCTPSIRATPSAATAGEKHHHHLLDPSKKTGGRLRSPLPSPIPSPIVVVLCA